MPEKDTLAEWLYWRFGGVVVSNKEWSELSEDDHSYWENEANAVRRAVARGGFKESDNA